MKPRYTEALDPNKPHLGGNYIELNPSTFAPLAWLYVIEKYNIKSVLDVGSGRGHAAKWFAEQGLQVTAIDGLEDNIKNAVYPTQLVDLTLSKYTVLHDLVHCIEVVEHIEEQYLDNLLETICSGRFLLMTHAVPGQTGHHHVNCQPTEYWVKHLASRGFRLLEEDSKQIQTRAKKAQHIRANGMLFVKN